MPTNYTEADLGTTSRAKALMLRDFPELREAEVTLTVMFAHNPDGPAVKLHGAPCAAKIKVNSLADRAEGKQDVTITIDAEIWEGKSERGCEALLWHELNHPIVVRDKRTRTIKRDALGRPRLKMRMDDYTINGFTDCAKRYGTDSPEYASLSAVAAVYRQLDLWDAWFPASEDRAAGRRRSAASH